METYEDRINKIEQLPGQIASLVAGLTPAQLTTPFLHSEWTVAQNVHHLFDSHANSYIRCKLIMSEDIPPLKGYDPNVWANFPDATDADVSRSLLLLTGLHHRWVMFWRNLTVANFSRQGMHSESGLVSLNELLTIYSGHGLAHIDQIKRTVAAGGIHR